MKKHTTLHFVIFALIFLSIIPSLGRYIDSLPYFLDFEIAIAHKSRSKNHITMAVISGEEGTVYIALCDNNSIGAYSFRTKTVNGELLYKVAEEESLSYQENYMVKINTAPHSTEQLAFGIGEALAKECSEKTGLKAEFIQFGNAGKLYTVWYIISADGLDELPDLQRGYSVFEHYPPKESYIALIILFGAIIIVVVAIRRSSKPSKKKTQYADPWRRKP